jgi:hypothetical protein
MSSGTNNSGIRRPFSYETLVTGVATRTTDVAGTASALALDAVNVVVEYPAHRTIGVGVQRTVRPATAGSGPGPVELAGVVADVAGVAGTHRVAVADADGVALTDPDVVAVAGAGVAGDVAAAR